MPKWALIWLSSTLAISGFKLSFWPSAFSPAFKFEIRYLSYFKLPIRKSPSARKVFKPLKLPLFSCFCLSEDAPESAYLLASRTSISKSNKYFGLLNCVMPKLPLIWLSSTLALSGFKLNFSPSALRLMLMFEARVLPYFKLPTRMLPSAFSAFSALKSSALSAASFLAGASDLA